MPLRMSGWGLVTLLALGLFLWNPFARIAADYSQDVTLGSASIYATLRTANAVMSVAKDAKIEASGGVVSVEGSPGQVLQPVTNTIDRLADLLFGLAIVSGIISAVLVPISKVAALVLAIAAFANAAIMTTRAQVIDTVEAVIRPIVFIGILGAIALPLAYTVAFYAGNHITADAWNHASRVINQLDSAYDQTALDEQLETLPAPTSSEPAEPSPVEESAAENEAAEGGIFRNGLRAFGSAVDASRSAISETVDAAANLATSVTGNVASQTKAIRDGLALSGDLFSASLQIAVSYLVKLVVLPVLVLAAAFTVLRSIFNGGRRG